MDKNLVSIDNLVRQRLAGKEEKEREGSWLQMRELLDKEMPQNKPVWSDWRRSLIYAGVVLFTATLGIGGYKLSSHTNFFSFGKVTDPVVLNTTPAHSEVVNTPVSPNRSSRSAQAIGKNASKITAIAANTPKHKKNTLVNKVAATSGNNKVIADKLNRTNADDATIGTTSQKNILASNITTDNNSKDVLKSTSKKGHKSIINNVVTDIPTNGTSKTAPATPGSSTSSNSSQEKSIASPGTKDNNFDNNTNETKSIKHGTKHFATSAAVTANKAIGKKMLKDNGPAMRTGNTADASEKEGVTKNNTDPSENRITVNKVVLNKHFVHSESNGGYFTFDTISKEKLFEQLHAITAVADESKIDVAKNNPLENAVASNSKMTGSDNSGSSNDILSSGAPSLKTLQENKATGLQQKKGGSKMLENLTAAFNDIKYDAANMEFSKGLTAGLNGTFFGPTSFYGFQFGVTGSFNFGDNVTVMTEFKYCQRINSNYQLNDDYYTYESNKGGGYTKSKIDYAFSFSTLHSFELPVSLKYNINNFSCFAGGNFLYMFGINTGAAPLPDPNTPAQVVSAVGNDNHPTLNYKDFGQRFGIGYLFGISFKISPNSALDLRTVQTVWDNLKSDGAKTVSNTLYKSPSIQLSYNYRLGASKKGDSNK